MVQTRGLDVKRLTNAEISAELSVIEAQWDRMIVAGKIDAAQRKFSGRFNELRQEQERRLSESAPSVIRLRFLAGESSRDLDKACAEALGWRVSHDEWWNWHPGPVFDPPGDAWCIRKDGRLDVPCDEALPHFTAESFEQLLRTPSASPTSATL